MTVYPILFNQTPAQLRRIGARGGRARARNWRVRQRAQAATVRLLPPHQPLVETTAPASAALDTHGGLPLSRSTIRPIETTARAIATLDAQFPWLAQLKQRVPRG